MTAPFFDAETMAELGELAAAAMQTPVVISRRSVAARGSSIVADDYGDDDVTYTQTGETRRRTVYGMLSSTPTPVQVEDGGQIVTVNTYALSLPAGTDIKPGDEATIGGTTYTVSDTTDESTWQAILLVSLRRLE